MYTIGGELYHHGIQGQRWGHRNGPPYPLTSSAKSKAEKTGKTKRSESGGLGDYIRKKRKQKQIKKQTKKVEKDLKVLVKKKEEMENWDEKKKQLLQFDSDTDKATRAIVKNLSKMSNDDIKKTLTRLEDIEKLKKYIKKNPTKYDKLKKKVDNVLDNVDWLSKKVNVGIDAWNTMARIVNTFDEKEEPTMLIIKKDFPTKKEKEQQQKNKNKNQNKN